MMDLETSEYDLALRAREGDREALAELVERTRLRLFALAYAELRQLPGDQAVAIRMYYRDELSVREIGRRLGRAEGTITSWLHRGRRNLAAQMEDDAPMTPSPTDTTRATQPSRRAALIHTELDPALIQQVMEALQAGGYAPQIVTPGELPRL